VCFSTTLFERNHGELQMSDEYPYGFEDAARFHGMVICLPMHDWRTGGEEYMYGVLDSQFGHPWVHMRYYPGRESPSYHQSSFRLFKYKVVGSYGFWEPEEREQQQARDMANFHFRLATKAECGAAGAKVVDRLIMVVA
jgi:hypothetical protein